MPAVFVHGVPDTHRVWNTLLSRITRKDVVALSLPGFGCPVPEGFDATKEAYVDWLLGELARQSARAAGRRGRRAPPFLVVSRR